MKQTAAGHGHVGRVALVVVAGLLLALGATFFYGGSAEAKPKEPYSSQRPEVLPTRITDDNEKRQPDDGDTVGGLEVDDRSGVLPFTGADIMLFLIIGSAAVGTGFVLVRKTRSDNI